MGATNTQGKDVVMDSKDGKQLFQSNLHDFCCRFEIIDETRIPYYSPEANGLSPQWVEGIVYWECRNIIFSKYLGQLEN